MSTQVNLFGEQRRLSSIFCLQPAPTAEAQRASEEREAEIKDTADADILCVIEEKRERIAELKEEIEDDEAALRGAEADDISLEPDEGEEVIFNAVVPQLETDLENTRIENEKEISDIEYEIQQLEAKLKP